MDSLFLTLSFFYLTYFVPDAVAFTAFVTAAFVAAAVISAGVFSRAASVVAAGVFISSVLFGVVSLLCGSSFFLCLLVGTLAFCLSCRSSCSIGVFSLFLIIVDYKSY